MVKWLIGIVGMVIAGIIVFWLTTGNTTNGTNSVGIHSPLDGVRVNHKALIEGKYHESDTADLWIVVQPIASPYYHPQPGPVPKDPKGKWRGVAYVGESDEKNIGEEFLIFIVATDSSVSSIFSGYLIGAATKKHWPGFAKLPTGTIPIDSVRVIRK